MPEWLRRLNPLYASQKSDVELLALVISNNMTLLRLDKSLERMTNVLDGASLADQLSDCEVSYELPLGNSGKIRKWQVEMLSRMVRENLGTSYGVSHVYGYRFIYNEPGRVMSFYAQFRFYTER
jgi:hypothetical protein